MLNIRNVMVLPKGRLQSLCTWTRPQKVLCRWQVN